MAIRLTFHGAAECVTGFCARLEVGETAVLIDCGMFQGPKTLKALNYGPFPFDPAKIDAVLLTHAHIDHSGLLPKLMKAGFQGPVYATAPTRELCRILLADSGEIQESEVRRLNRRNEQRDRPLVEPIFTAAEAAETLDLFRNVRLKEWVEVAPGLSARFWNAGHILGSTSIEVLAQDADGPVRLLFSGDLGQGGREYAADPEGPSGVDHLVVESTYGNRERDDLDSGARRRRLAAELNDAHAAGGPVLIPAFAVERSQELMVDLLTLMSDGVVPKGPIFLDSPLAIEASRIFLRRGWNADSGRNPFETISDTDQLRFLDKPSESDQLDRLKGWHIILAGSGMCDAGRVRKHLKRLLWRRECTVLITGFQAAGTLGRLLAEGRTAVRIQGDDIRVHARVRTMDVYSAHADATGLVAWAKARRPVAGKLFLTHGEPENLAGLNRRLVEAGFPADQIITPALDESFVLRGAQAQVGEAAPPRLLPGGATALDWHNARAELLEELELRLDRTGDDEAKMAVIRSLAKALRQA
jgi:metallo-beta-lactamase family protein